MTVIAAVVATHNRPELLAGRALTSIAEQTRRPDLLVVVDDSDAETRSVNAAIAAGFESSAGVKTFYMENRRAPGASGAWNSALAHLQATAPEAFVAILDDDDAWAPSYLEQCEKATLAQDLDMVAAGIVYHEAGAPRRQAAGSSATAGRERTAGA